MWIVLILSFLESVFPCVPPPSPQCQLIHNTIPFHYQVCGQYELELELNEIYGQPFHFRQSNQSSYPFIPYGMELHYLQFPQLNYSSTLRVLILVLSSVSEIQHRQRIRPLFKQINNYSMGYFFILARNQSLDVQIERENRRYKDILQVDVIDSYHNLSLTVLSALHYLSRYTHISNYILKTDSDCVINFPRLSSIVEELRGDYVGDCVNGSTYNYRNSSRKNYVPKSLIGTMTRIAYYSTGAGYMISMEALPKLLTGYRYLPFISHNEDVNVGRAMGLIGIPCTKIPKWRWKEGYENEEEYVIVHKRKN